MSAFSLLGAPTAVLVEAAGFFTGKAFGGFFVVLALLGFTDRSPIRPTRLSFFTFCCKQGSLPAFTPLLKCSSSLHFVIIILDRVPHTS